MSGSVQRRGFLKAPRLLVTDLENKKFFIFQIFFRFFLYFFSKCFDFFLISERCIPSAVLLVPVAAVVSHQSAHWCTIRYCPANSVARGFGIRTL